MLEKIENSIADAQMVLVGIGAEMEADMDGKDASFYDSLKEQAERDPAAAQLFRFMQAQKKGQRSREELEKSYQKLSKLLEGKNYFIVFLCDDGLIYEAGFDTERVVTRLCGKMTKHLPWKRMIFPMEKRSNLLRQVMRKRIGSVT